ncbi:hypothetical protein [Candidatus Methylacidithermus pantelleriae]|uniref:Uncharacterized protein n=1 Tax=Candidatus Methylacidithermus pantelleriae TaxID=2744239 RepID=A0A8J2BLF4_9BACT|nr:hypothetical protein [Candidatus Methylacidithermus pantelleriae]CAF0702658.1 hypothetical protein MPNT_50148 [Candidatus Methylacidithermus pantelleriae]
MILPRGEGRIFEQDLAKDVLETITRVLGLALRLLIALGPEGVWCGRLCLELGLGRMAAAAKAP